ncbi:MAG: L,D-transpeptidase family protein [Acidobacteriia bacterium]|nr:L,D-transpeptidase family protein [Terriglobia bacterium]
MAHTDRLSQVRVGKLCGIPSMPKYRMRTLSASMFGRDVKWRTAFVVIFILTAALGISAQERGWSKRGAGNASANERVEAPELTVRTLVRAGRIDNLRWPDFSDFRNDVEKFYSRLEYAPAWLRAGRASSQALQMIAILQEADSEGLRAEDYDSSRWAERLAHLRGQHSVSEEVRFDVALTVCAMRYVSAIRVGRINPRYFKFALDAGPQELDLPKFVQQRLANGKELKSELAGIEPPFVGYRKLREVLGMYLRLAKEDDGQKLPMPTEPGYPGPPYPGFARLTRLLRLLDDLPASYAAAAANSRMFDPTLLQAVGRFQERHGLPATGYLDDKTMEQLNVPLTDRVDQIRLAMERYRWFRYHQRQESIVVNIPGFHLYALDEQGKIALSMRVDVGEDFDNTRTPVMDDSVEYVVFRPYWDVPPDIQRDELMPIITATPDLSAFHYEAVSPTGQVVADAKLTQPLLEQLRAGKLHIRQRPGSDNPMGLVKFIFPNRYNVYLHDTPLREIEFIVPQRIVSHGCIHVENPAELAAWMLRDQPGWTLQQVQQAMHHGQDDLRVDLSKPLLVLIFYTTVSTWRHGHVHFYRDIYGYDADLRKALARGYPYPQ